MAGMKMPAMSSPAAGGVSAVSPVSPAVSTPPPPVISPVAVPADNADTADSQVPNQLKQLKTKVTERVKKVEGKPDTIIWDVRVGLAFFNVYRTPIGDRELFTLSYRLDGKRYRQVLPTLAEAIEAAKAKGKQLSRGDIVAVDMSPADRASAAKVLGWLKPLGLSLELVVAEALDARKRLGPVTISRAVDSHLKRYPQNMPSKMVKEVVEEMIGIKRADKLSDRYIKQLEYNMNRFMGRFKNRLLDVGGTDVDAWLRELNVGPRTRNNLRNSVQALFNYAIARKYLPKDHDEIDAVPMAKDRGGEIEIYTPSEMKELLSVASDEHVPFLAISAFAGVRHAEVKRLDWANVNRKAKIIEIKAGTAKTASRRVIPIQPNLAKWLKPHWKESGEICSFANMVLQFVELTRRINEKRRDRWAKANNVSKEELKAADQRAEARLAKLTANQRRSRGTVMPGAEMAEDEGWKPFLWKHNALRHSFISYYVSQCKNVAQVALEAGNSPGMIFKHYNELVQPDAAKAWFGLMPAGKN
jgi:integrase